MTDSKQEIASPQMQAKIIDASPSQFRYLLNSEGAMVLQGGHKFITPLESGVEWIDVPVVNG